METRSKQALAGLALASIIVATVFSMGAFGLGQTSTASSSVSNCEQSTGPANTPDMATVYHVTSTQAVICVTYMFQGAGRSDFTTVVQPWYQTGSEIGTPSQCPYTNCPAPTITASPAWIDHGARAEVRVTYTIESSANTTGLFVVIHAGCDPLYLSFGLVPSSMFLQAWTCGPVNILSDGYRSDNYNVTSVTNIEVVSVPWV